MRLIFFAAFLVAGLAKPQAGPLEADVHLTFPLTKQKMLGIYVDARLYEYDPWLADAPATLVDQVEFEGLDLSTKAHSLLDVHFSAKRKTRMNYYMSIRAYAEKGGTQYYFIDGFQKIFEGVDVDELDIELATRLPKKNPTDDPVFERSRSSSSMDCSSSPRRRSICCRLNISWSPSRISSS